MGRPEVCRLDGRRWASRSSGQRRGPGIEPDRATRDRGATRWRTAEARPRRQWCQKAGGGKAHPYRTGKGKADHSCLFSANEQSRPSSSVPFPLR